MKRLKRLWLRNTNTFRGEPFGPPRTLISFGSYDLLVLQVHGGIFAIAALLEFVADLLALIQRH